MRHENLGANTLSIIECKDGCAPFRRNKRIVAHLILLSSSATQLNRSTCCFSFTISLFAWSLPILASFTSIKPVATATIDTTATQIHGRLCTKLLMSLQTPFVKAQPYFKAYTPASFVVASSTKLIVVFRIFCFYFTLNFSLSFL